MAEAPADLVWACTNGNNSYLLKRKQSGGVSLSRDPLNLTNKHSRKYEGFVNEKAIGIQPGNDGKGLVLITKKPSVAANRPASLLLKQNSSGRKGTRLTYKGIVNQTAKRNYRPDLRREAVARASAIRSSQRENRGQNHRESKPRGKKAKQAKEAGGK